MQPSLSQLLKEDDGEGMLPVGDGRGGGVGGGGVEKTEDLTIWIRRIVTGEGLGGGGAGRGEGDHWKDRRLDNMNQTVRYWVGWGGGGGNR